MLPRSVVQRCRSEVSLKSVAYMRVCGACVCSGVLLGSADQKHWSEVLLRTVDQRLSVRGVDQQCRIRSVARKCCSEVSVGSVAQQCGSEVLIRSVAPSEMLRRSVSLKYRAEVWMRSIDQKCCSELSIVVSVRGVDQQCRISSVALKCVSEVLLRSVDQTCQSELLLGSVSLKCCLEVSLRKLIAAVLLLRSAAQKCR